VRRSIPAAAIVVVSLLATGCTRGDEIRAWSATGRRSRSRRRTSAPATACTTHLVRPGIDAATQGTQIGAVITLATDRRAEPFILGGDFNADEGAFAPLLVGGGYVSVPEPSSIDRVLASNSHFAVASTRRFRCECSDHAALLVTLSRRTGPADRRPAV